MQNAVRGRNNSIDIFRYVCAALVVCTHVKAIADFSEVGNYFFNQIASRITVLYFFAVAGYYYIAGLEKGEKGISQILWENSRCLYGVERDLRGVFVLPGE